MNEVSNFMYYMYNKWDDSEATLLFGKDLGAYIFGKWQDYNGRVLEWYGALDKECRQIVVDRADDIYGKAPAVLNKELTDAIVHDMDKVLDGIGIEPVPRELIITIAVVTLKNYTGQPVRISAD